MYNDMNTANLISNQAKYTIDTIWLVASAVVALLGGILIYAIFVSNKKEGQNKSFINWLHQFLNFRTLFIDTVLKVLYIITAIFITLSSFSFMRVSVAYFFLWLILGNIIARISFEFISLLLTLVTNTTEINEKINNNSKEKTKRQNKAK